jgi:hypothetical protein
VRWLDGWAARLDLDRRDTARWVLTWPCDAPHPWQRILDIDIAPSGTPMRLLQIATVQGEPQLVLELAVRGKLRWLRAPPCTRTCRELVERARARL